MARDYWFSFAAQPSTAASLAPTFITFVDTNGTTYAAPAIAEKYPGSGLYRTTFGATQTMSFVLDGATTSLAASQRYIAGVFDPQDTMGQTLTGMAATLMAVGSTLLGVGNTLAGMGITLSGIGNTVAGLGFQGGSLFALIGTTASSFGDTLTDPSTLFGFLKRSQEFWEGNQAYAKASGLMDFYNRGSSTLLREKLITDTTSTTTKT